MEDAKRRAQETYDAAADHFDDAALGFWDRYGRATVERLGLTPGATVLDVCAGTGASALPAARLVAPSGRVVAVDLADNLLALARTKAEEAGLANVVETVNSDVDALDYPGGAFDAVVVVFGVFFFPDMGAITERLWRWVRPGGRLAVTTWGPRLFEPANSIFWDAVAAVRPELDRAYRPWDSLTEPDAVRGLLTGAGTASPDIEAVAGAHPLRTVDDFWTIVLGTGYRATYEQLTETERRMVRDHVLAQLTARDVTSIETNVIHAIATKPA